MPKSKLLVMALMAAPLVGIALPEANAGETDPYSDKYLTQSSRTERLRELDERYNNDRRSRYDEEKVEEPIIIYQGAPDMPLMDGPATSESEGSGEYADPYASRGGSSEMGNIPNEAVGGSAGFAPTYSSGNDVPLTSAVRQIVPQGGCWVLKVEPGIGSKPISWEGRGRAWRDVLERALRAEGLSVVMDAGTCTIAIARTQSLATSMLNGGGMFTLNPSQTLRENLTRWAAESGWRLIWDVEGLDYIVEVDATLFGSFEGPDGVLAKVLNYYKDAETPLRGLFTADGSGMRVVRIVPRTFRNAGDGA